MVGRVDFGTPLEEERGAFFLVSVLELLWYGGGEGNISLVGWLDGCRDRKVKLIGTERLNLFVNVREKGVMGFSDCHAKFMVNTNYR